MRYIVLDFEATCDEPDNPAPQEMIEFPALVMEPDPQRIVAEFHTYCFDCGYRRAGSPPSATVATPASWKAGDWVCPQCGEHNFARRNACFRCGSRR